MVIKLYIVLYNPLSSKGQGRKRCLKLERKLKRKHQKFESFDLLGIVGRESEFIKSVDPKDIVVIVGGDGTLHQFINRTRNYVIPNRIFMYRAGRGNDFSREHKGRFFEITDELKALPKISYLDKEDLFINGVGIGIDAAVCNGQIQNAMIGLKQSYFSLATHIFRTFKQFKITVDIDSKKYSYDDAWFLVVQNGKYFGGGMKIAPKAERTDEHLDIVVVHKVKVWKLMMVFPLIFFGKHVWFKHLGIEFMTGKHIIVDTEGYDVIQKDGEVVSQVNHFEVERYWK